MSTGIQVIPQTAITIGTTPITSGVAGRVLFEGSGNVVQEDAAITFNQTTKALTLTSNYVATGVPTLQIIGSGINVCPYYRVVSDGGVSEATLVATRTGGASAGGTNRAFLSLNNAAGGHNVISSNDGLAFSAAGHTGYNSTNDQMRLKNGNLSVGTGYSGVARLDVRAQGALSTDIALRVRNSADTVDIFKIQGNGAYIYRNNVNNSASSYDALGQWDYYSSGTTLSVVAGVNSRIVADAGAASIRFGSATHSLVCLKSGNFQLEDNAILQTSGQGGLSLKNGTNPSASTIDRFNLYSADITAGNAAPHFRTENGSVIKLYKQDLPTSPTNAELATFLSNLGLANLI